MREGPVHWGGGATPGQVVLRGKRKLWAAHAELACKQHSSANFASVPPLTTLPHRLRAEINKPSHPQVTSVNVVQHNRKQIRTSICQQVYIYK